MVTLGGTVAAVLFIAVALIVLAALLYVLVRILRAIGRLTGRAPARSGDVRSANVIPPMAPTAREDVTRGTIERRP